MTTFDRLELQGQINKLTEYYLDETGLKGLIYIIDSLRLHCSHMIKNDSYRVIEDKLSEIKLLLKK